MTRVLTSEYSRYGWTYGGECQDLTVKPSKRGRSVNTWQNPAYGKCTRSID